MQRAQQELWRLGTADGEAAVEDEEGDAIDAEGVGLRFVGSDFVGELIGGEHVSHFVFGQAGSDGEAYQGGVIAHQRALLEVSLEQTLFDGVLAAAGVGEMDEAVGVEGVARAEPIEIEGETFAARGIAQPLVVLARLLDADAVLSCEALDERGGGVQLFGCAGIELEGVPNDLHVVREFFECALEATFADVTPRAGDVGPDVDAHLCHGWAT